MSSPMETVIKGLLDGTPGFQVKGAIPGYVNPFPTGVDGRPGFMAPGSTPIFVGAPQPAPAPQPVPLYKEPQIVGHYGPGSGLVPAQTPIHSKPIVTFVDTRAPSERPPQGNIPGAGGLTPTEGSGALSGVPMIALIAAGLAIAFFVLQSSDVPGR